ncbi:hypothetical protein Tco_1394866, partial [Tanacetum coccineum]
KIVSQLAILGENISQEDLNLKFFRSLSSEWNTHVVVWRNKPDLHTMSFDDLYNNFKIVEQEVKGTTSSNSSLSSQNMAFVSSPSSTNEVNTAYGVSTTNTQVSPTSTQVSTANTQWIMHNCCLKWNGTTANDEIQVSAIGLTFYWHKLTTAGYCKGETISGEVQIQALVDKKKVIITETSIRRDFQLANENGTECLPNATIFVELERMGYENLTQKLTFYKAFFSPQWKFLIHTILQCLSAKTTAWNEFSSNMASAIICLATNQRFNFSKYIFDNMVKNLEGGVKFLMHPRFVQVFLDNQVEGMYKHKKIYVTPSHTKKVFANIKRQGKYFSGRDTPLFQTMMVQAQEEGKGSVMPIVPQHIPTINKPSSSQPPKKQKPKKTKK